jgi:hypothetical protein
MTLLTPPTEGSFFKLTDEEFEKIFRKTYSEEELERITLIQRQIKITDNKEVIFDQFDEFGQIRCKEYWNLYREAFFVVLDEIWNRRVKNERIMAYDLFEIIYTNINDDLVKLLNGSSFMIMFNFRVRSPNLHRSPNLC